MTAEVVANVIHPPDWIAPTDDPKQRFLLQKGADHYKESCLARWGILFRDSNHELHHDMILSSNVEYMLRKLAWRWWKIYAREKGEERRKLNRAKKFADCSLYCKYFDFWFKYRLHCQKKRALNQCAVRFYAEKLPRRIFNAWFDRLEESIEEERRLILKADRFRNAMLEVQCWKRWFGFNADNEGSKRRTEIAEEFRVRNALNRTFRKWSNQVVVSKRLSEEALQFYEKSLISSIFRNWIRTVALQTQNETKADGLYRMNLKRKCFESFHGNVQIKLHERQAIIAGLSCEKLMSSRAFYIWLLEFVKRRSEFHHNFKALQHWESVVCGRAWKGWKGYVDRRRRKKKREQEVLMLRKKLLMQQSYRQWLNATANVRTSRSQSISENTEKCFETVRKIATHWRRKTLKNRTFGESEKALTSNLHQITTATSMSTSTSTSTSTSPPKSEFLLNQQLFSSFSFSAPLRKSTRRQPRRCLEYLSSDANPRKIEKKKKTKEIAKLYFKRNDLPFRKALNAKTAAISMRQRCRRSGRKVNGGRFGAVGSAIGVGSTFGVGSTDGQHGFISESSSMRGVDCNPLNSLKYEKEDKLVNSHQTDARQGAISDLHHNLSSQPASSVHSTQKNLHPSHKNFQRNFYQTSHLQQVSSNDSKPTKPSPKLDAEIADIERKITVFEIERQQYQRNQRELQDLEVLQKLQSDLDIQRNVRMSYLEEKCERFNRTKLARNRIIRSLANRIDKLVAIDGCNRARGDLEPEIKARL